MTLTQRDKRAVVLGGILIAAAVGWRFGVQPAFATWTDARATVAAHHAQLDTLEHQLTQRDAIQARLIRKYGPAADTELKDVETTRIELPKAAQDALRGAGTGVKSIDLQGVRKLRNVPGVSMVSVRVQGSCAGDALPAVLASLRTAPMLILLDDAQITLATGNGGSGDGGQRGRGHGGGGHGGGDKARWTLNLLLSAPARGGAS